MEEKGKLNNLWRRNRKKIKTEEEVEVMWFAKPS